MGNCSKTWDKSSGWCTGVKLVSYILVYFTQLEHRTLFIYMFCCWGWLLTVDQFSFATNIMNSEVWAIEIVYGKARNIFHVARFT